MVEFEENKRLTMRITGTNLPFKSAEIHFLLQPDNDSTIVTVSPLYKLKFGVFGKLLNTVFVHRTYLKGMQALLHGLKKFVESNKKI